LKEPAVFRSSLVPPNVRRARSVDAALRAIGHMRKLQKSPQRVRNYFKHKLVRYAA
jgi:hypothetical protein